MQPKQQRVGMAIIWVLLGLAMSGVAMFAPTIPVLAAILALYRDGRLSGVRF